MARITYEEHYQAVLEDVLHNLTDFIEATVDCFEICHTTNADIERREAGIKLGQQQRIATSMRKRDQALAAAHAARKITQDYLHKRPQSAEEKALGAHYAEMVNTYAEQEAQRFCGAP